VVVLTTSAQEIKIETSSGEITIDWGDGKTDSYTSTDETEHTHTYSNNHSHTIQINAERLTDLDCSGNQLTALDVSKNTALTYLVCGNNLLTVDALNALLSGLPANNRGGNISIDYNPGSSACDHSLATDKGWYFHN
jgi:hypothetical protein